jgi:hypothetical protein
MPPGLMPTCEQHHCTGAGHPAEVSTLLAHTAQHWYQSCSCGCCSCLSISPVLRLQMTHAVLWTSVARRPKVSCIAPHRPWCRSSVLSFEFSLSQGPPGTGKTTSILALAHGLLGTNYREGVLELNASDDRCAAPQARLSRLHRQLWLRLRWM